MPSMIPPEMMLGAVAGNLDRFHRRDPRQQVGGLGPYVVVVWVIAGLLDLHRRLIVNVQGSDVVAQVRELGPCPPASPRSVMHGDSRPRLPERPVGLTRQNPTPRLMRGEVHRVGGLLVTMR